MNIRTRDEHFHVKYIEDYNTRESVHSAGEAIIESPAGQAFPGLKRAAGVELAHDDFGYTIDCPAASASTYGRFASAG